MKKISALYNNKTLCIIYSYYMEIVLMPAVRKASREQIIDAAVAILRDEGFSAINARSVAKKLGCSTQPIYFSFKNMDELKAALTERAIELHTQRVRDSLRAHEGSDSRYSSYGMGQIRRRGKAAVPLALTGGEAAWPISERRPASGDRRGHRRGIRLQRGGRAALSSGHDLLYLRSGNSCQY